MNWSLAVKVVPLPLRIEDPVVIMVGPSLIELTEMVEVSSKELNSVIPPFVETSTLFPALPDPVVV